MKSLSCAQCICHSKGGRFQISCWLGEATVSMLQVLPEHERLGAPWNQGSDDWQTALMQQIGDLPDVMDADLHSSLGPGFADLQALSGTPLTAGGLCLVDHKALLSLVVVFWAGGCHRMQDP